MTEIRPAPLSPEAIGRLGVDYWHGWGVPQSHALAVEQFQIAAAAGDPAALFWLGVASAEGKGAPQDSDLARSYFKRASRAGDKQARAYLATLDRGREQSGSWAGVLFGLLGGAIGAGLAVYLHQSPLICGAAVLLGVAIVALARWLLRPEKDPHADALAAVARQQVHGVQDEGTI